jgi:hypothetical protein
MEQDDPCVLNIMRQKFLHPPSTLALQLEHPETENPSMGQAQSVMNILKNKVNIYTLAMNFKFISSVIVFREEGFSLNAVHWMVKPVQTLSIWRGNLDGKEYSLKEIQITSKKSC